MTLNNANNTPSDWEAVIGLEVHVQLNTQSKIFSGASTDFGSEPNTQACAIDLGLPGVLPVLNAEAVNMAIQLGLAIDAKINPKSVFARKNYFYPDLPKGYQISQYELPVVEAGHLDVLLDQHDAASTKRIRITRAHLEEDAGKSLHEDFDGCSGIDLNRAGVPLLEIVSEPDLRSAKEAVAYLKALHTLVRYLGICDGNMQEGSFRCDANVSVRKIGDPKLGTRAEVKNVNSFRFVEKAIEYEISRQIDILENGGSIVQETRLYDAEKDQTRSMRSKESANDYRYFPDPDLLPLIITEDQIVTIKSKLPELPQEKLNRFQSKLALSLQDALTLSNNRNLADYFETTLKHMQKPDAKLASNWISVELLGALNKNNLEIEDSPISAELMASLLNKITDKTVSGKIAKSIFEALWNRETQDVDAYIETHNLKQVTDDSAIIKAIQEIIANNPNQVTEYRAGKDKLFGFFVGQAMKATQGKANPEQLNQLLKHFLNV
ncbi:MAG: Asp-tRNA(Asn)/Glu-tRNA(Gln) amidotransferase subunit GatB [Gammaproteobacteria bacterium]